MIETRGKTHGGEFPRGDPRCFGKVFPAAVTVGGRSIRERLVLGMDVALAVALVVLCATWRADALSGERVYALRCAVCHGAEGRGDGPLAAPRRPRPRDFSGGIFKVKSTPAGEPPTLDDVRRTIRRGMGGGSMPAWEAVLSAAEIDAVAEHERGLGPLAAWSPPERAVSVDAGILAQASADRGRELFRDLGCPACHGPQGKGDGPAAPALKDVWKQPAPPRDLTAPRTFIGGDSPEDLYRRVSIGIPGTPMPGYAESASPADIADVVAFLRSIARPAVIGR